MGHGMKFLSRTFLKGLVTIVPISATLYLLWWAGTSAEAVGALLLRRVLPPDMYRPGTGLVLGLALVFVVGLAMHAWIARRIYRALEHVLGRIPLVKSVYGPLKDLMQFFDSAPGEKAHQAVELSVGADRSLLGLLTRDSAAKVNGRADDTERVAVYLPMSYQIGGFMVLAPRSDVESLDMDVETLLKTTISAGLSGTKRPEKR